MSDNQLGFELLEDALPMFNRETDASGIALNRTENETVLEIFWLGEDAEEAYEALEGHFNA